MSRKPRKTSNLERNRPKYKPYDRVLIVCEGSETEPNYLQELCDHLKLSSANIEVDGSSDSSPNKVVEHAIQRYQDDKDFDRIYCVFDKDTHTTFDQARQRIKDSQRVPIPIYESVSIPCFEFWLLLHFRFTTKPYSGTGKKSSADCVIDDLEIELPKINLLNYDKGSKGMFQLLRDRLEIAIEHSKRVQKQAEKSQTDNPSTQIHALVEYLHNLKR